MWGLLPGQRRHAEAARSPGPAATGVGRRACCAATPSTIRTCETPLVPRGAHHARPGALCRRWAQGEARVPPGPACRASYFHAWFGIQPRGGGPVVPSRGDPCMNDLRLPIPHRAPPASSASPRKTTEWLYLLGAGGAHRRHLGLHRAAAPRARGKAQGQRLPERQDRQDPGAGARLRVRLLRPAGRHRECADPPRRAGHHLQPAQRRADLRHALPGGRDGGAAHESGLELLQGHA